MFRTFNMGVGMVIVCAEEDKAAICGHLGEEWREIGRVVEGRKEVTIQ
jgi:phosphoribosylaminoimidazole (AIR) synthetase